MFQRACREMGDSGNSANTPFDDARAADKAWGLHRIAHNHHPAYSRGMKCKKCLENGWISRFHREF
jgi:hypothetical protein